MAKLIKNILFAFIIFLMFIPLIQNLKPFYKTKPLQGYSADVPKPDLKWLTLRNWTSELFQKKMDTALNEHFGFRNVLIRLNNQIDYTLFHKTNATHVVIGRNNCLFEEGYILDYSGINFAGEAYLDEVLRRTKRVQDFLKKEKNIDLIIVFEPGKASFYPEYIPSRYLKNGKSISNYRYLSDRCRELNIVHTDLNQWFVSMKDTTSYPLYTKSGVHWTLFGMYRAADSLARFIEGVRNIDMPDMIWRNHHVTNELKDEDFDIEATMNLLFPLPYEALCYPEINYESTNKIRPKLLTVGDSYYWAFISNHVVDSMYSGHQYWYYNAGIWPDIWTFKSIPEVLDIKTEIEKQEVILVMITELNTYKAFWGFTDNLYNLYFPGDTNSEYNLIKELVNNDAYLISQSILADKYGDKVADILRKEAVLLKKISAFNSKK